MSETTTGATVSEYVLKLRYHSKICTMVTLTNGREIRFTERVSKRLALKNAAYLIDAEDVERIERLREDADPTACVCRHPVGWHRYGQGSCLECSCLTYRLRDDAA